MMMRTMLIKAVTVIMCGNDDDDDDDSDVSSGYGFSGLVGDNDDDEDYLHILLFLSTIRNVLCLVQPKWWFPKSVCISCESSP